MKLPYKDLQPGDKVKVIDYCPSLHDVTVKRGNKSYYLLREFVAINEELPFYMEQLTFSL
jgi:hypothetical protein